MSEFDENELTLDVTQTAEALGKIAEDENAFRLLIQSFRAQDYEGFRDLLGRFDLLDRCELVCRWLISKECALVCFRLCGPPPQEPPRLDLREYGELIAKITADRETLDRLVGAVTERDELAFKAIVEKLGIQRYCHYICHWICWVRYRLVCDLLCGPAKPAYIIGCSHLTAVLLQASAAITRLVAMPKTLAAVEKGALARDCIVVRTALERAGFQGVCHYICYWICSWRCVRVCFLVCRPFVPVEIEYELPEIHAFAQATAKLAERPELATKLVQAVGNEDADAFAELVQELGYHRFCHQLCLWLCRLYCRRFCICVCPPPRPRPWFTHVGHFHIYGDIDATSGLTNKQKLGHGGPDYGFFSCLELRGFCPADSPTSPGVGMRYRFLYERGGNQTPLTGSLLCKVIVGSRTIWWDADGTGMQPTFQEIQIAGSGATPDPTPLPGFPPPWGPPPPHVITPDPDGWITVDPLALGAAFSGALIGFNTRVPFPGGDPAPGVVAGTQVPAGNLKDGVDVAIIFEATRLGGPTSPPDHSNTLSRIHINNWNEVRLLDLLQFHTAGGTPCSPLSTDLDIEYTADHELMLAWSLDIITAATIPGGTPVLPSGASTRAAGANIAFGTHHEDISAWPTCSYTVRLTTRRALTTGLIDDDADDIRKTFCIGARGKPKK